MRPSASIRIIFDIALLVSALFWPWWVTCVFIVVGIGYFPLFVEALPAAFIMDALFGRPLSGIGHDFPFSLGTATVFLVSFWLKGVLR